MLLNNSAIVLGWVAVPPDPSPNGIFTAGNGAWYGLLSIRPGATLRSGATIGFCCTGICGVSAIYYFCEKLAAIILSKSSGASFDNSSTLWTYDPRFSAL